MVIYKKINNYFLPALFFLILSLLLISAWFKGGHFYGGLDVGLPTYDPQRIFEMAKYIWWESIAPGFLFPHAITSITLYFFLSFFQFFGLGPVGIQAVLFFILIFLMGFGMYLLTISIIGQDKKIYAAIAGLFYIFNPYMMVQIWHRFVHTSFFFVAAIPFLILFWRRWIKSGNYLYLLYFLLVNFLASYMFGTIAFVFPLWLILSLFTLSEIFLPWENKSHLIKILWRSTLGLAFWILLNSWWLIPVLTISQGIVSQVFNIRDSIYTFRAISKQSILPFALQMVNSYYIFGQAELGEIYRSFFFRLIPWLGVGTIFCGLIYALRKRHLVFYPLIFFIIIMLSKGSSSPFGQPFLLLFSKFFALGVLRNPFEKIGVLLPVISSILFVVGIEAFFGWSGKRFGNLGSKFILIIFLALMGVYYWPMYQGTIFGTPGQPNYVEIPPSYKQADNWLNDRVNQEHSKEDGKILHLPLTRSDVVTYRWEHGYHGIDSSNSLFTALPSISRGTNLKNTDDGLTALSLIFQPPYKLHQDKILKLLQDFNVKFIVLHKDMVWKGSDTYDPQETEQVLDELNFLERKIQYGELVIYELLPQYFKSKVVLISNVNFASPNKANMRMWPYIISEKSNDFITSLGDRDNKIINQSNEAIIFPNNTFSYLEASGNGMDNVVNDVILDNNILNSAKTYIERDNDIDAKSLLNQLLNVSENLINIYVLSKSNQFLQVDSYLKSYQESMTGLLSQDLRNSRLSLYFNSASVVIDNVYKHHLLVLEYLELKLNPSQNEIIRPLINKIRQDLISLGLVPSYPSVNKNNLTILERQINQFDIPKKGDYELLMSNRISRDIYPGKLAKLEFQVNDKTISLQAKEKGDLISYGNMNLNEGLQEISFERMISENQFSALDQLIKVGDVKIIDQNTLQLSSNGIQPAFVDSQLADIQGEETFLVTFDALIQSGTGFYVQIIQDTDPLQGDIPKPKVKVSVYRTSQDSNWQTYKVQLPPLNLTTRKAVFRLIVDPSGATSFGDFSDNQSTTASIKNVQVGRVLDNPIYLYSEPQIPIASSSAVITQFNEETPVLYTGKIVIDQPIFMIFKETFNPGWELELIEGNKVYKVDKHYLANLYGNAWWIEKTGEYDLRIEFKPQQKVILGFYLAVGGFLILLSLEVGSKIKQKYGRS